MKKDITRMEQRACMREQELLDAILKLQSGDVNAFDTIYLHTNRFMFQKASQLLASYYNKDSELRNDMVQDAYIKIFQNIGSLQEPEKFYGWMNTILVNTIYAYTRAHWREEFDVVDEEGKSVIEEKGSDSENPEAYVLEDERIQYVNDALQTLPPLQRFTVEYFYFSEMSVEEIATVMGCSEGTVKSRLNYARKKLKGAIEEIEKTKKIKLHSIFALPLLLFVAKEEALAAEGVVDAATFSAVRQALLEKCVPNVNASTGSGNAGEAKPGKQNSDGKGASGEKGNGESSNREGMNGKSKDGDNMSGENTNGKKAGGGKGTNPVSSVSTSIWKTAAGKIMVSITAVLVTAGVIMGGLYILGNDSEGVKDSFMEEELQEGSIAGNDDSGEAKDNTTGNVAEGTTGDAPGNAAGTASSEATGSGENGKPIEGSGSATGESGRPTDEVKVDPTSLVAEDGYIHVGTNAEEGTPIVYGFTSHEDIAYYTEVRNTYFPTGQEAVINLGYQSDKDLRTYEIRMVKGDVTGAYTIDEWPESVVIDGITREDYVNSGAKGLYLDGNVIHVYWASTPENEATEMEHIMLRKEGSRSYAITGYRYGGTAEERYQEGKMAVGEYFVQSFTFQSNLLTDESWTPVLVCKKPSGGGLAVEIGKQKYESEKKVETDLKVEITHEDAIRSAISFHRYQGSFGSFAQQYAPVWEELPEQFAEYEHYVSAWDGETDSFSDENNVSGRMLTAMLQYEDILQNHYYQLHEEYTQAATMLEKYSVLKKIYEPVSIVLFDEEYLFYAYETNAVYYDYETSIESGAGVWGYAVPTGNKVELEATDATLMSKKLPSNVEIPDITLEEVAYYNRETGMSKLKAADEQIKEVLNVLQLEMDEEYTTEEQGNTVRTILQKARELYFIVCADNACMKSYSDIGSNEWLAGYGLADFADIIERYETKADFGHYVNVYMYQHIGCMDGKLQAIKDSLAVIGEAELTKTQKTAMILTKELLDVFYANRGNYETVVRYYYELAGKTQDKDNENYRKLTGYDTRLEEMMAYEELIKDFPNWVFVK